MMMLVFDKLEFQNEHYSMHGFYFIFSFYISQATHFLFFLLIQWAFSDFSRCTWYEKYFFYYFYLLLPEFFLNHHQRSTKRGGVFQLNHSDQNLYHWKIWFLTSFSSFPFDAYQNTQILPVYSPSYWILFQTFFN